jgi:hypothetical protein
MKNIILAALLGITSTIAVAHGYYGDNWRGPGSVVTNDWLAPFIVGGALGYIIAQPPARTIILQPQRNYAPPAGPVYRYDNIYDNSCACYRQILVQIY